MWPTAEGKMREDAKVSQEATGEFGAALTGVVGSRAGASLPTRQGRRGPAPALPHCHHPWVLPAAAC